MRNTCNCGSVFRLKGFAQVTQPLFCPHPLFSKLQFFSVTVFKREIIGQSVLTWLKILVIVSFAQYQKYSKYFSFSTNANLVADWWWTVILITLGLLLNLHPCCKMRATKCVQRTIALYQYKLKTVQPIPIFCNRVLWRSYVQTLDTVCVIEIRDSFFFSRHAQPPLALWLRALQCEWINILLRTLSIWFMLDRNALRFSFCCKGNPENQAQCDCSFFFIFFL